MKFYTKILTISLLSLSFLSCRKDGIEPLDLSHFLKYYGEGAKDDVVFDMKQMNDGGYLLAGYTEESGDRDGYILKVSNLGILEWKHVFGDFGSDQFNEILLTDNIYVVGTDEDSATGNNIKLTSLSYSGELIFDSIYHKVGNQEGNSLDIAFNNIYIGGSTTEGNSTDKSASKDFYILKVQNDGVQLLSARDGQTGENDEIYDIDLINNQIYFTGITDYKVFSVEDNLDLINIAQGIFPLELNAPANFTSIGGQFDDKGKQILDIDQQYIVIGNEINEGRSTIFASKFQKGDVNVDGLRDVDLSFVLNYSSTGNTEANCIKKTQDGGFILTGSTDAEGNGGNDVLLIKTDSEGTVEWSKTFGGEGEDIGHSVIQDSDNGYVISGESTFGADKQIILIKVNELGEL